MAKSALRSVAKFAQIYGQTQLTQGGKDYGCHTGFCTHIIDSHKMKCNRLILDCNILDSNWIGFVLQTKIVSLALLIAGKHKTESVICDKCRNS